MHYPTMQGGISWPFTPHMHMHIILHVLFMCHNIVLFYVEHLFSHNSQIRCVIIIFMGCQTIVYSREIVLSNDIYSISRLHMDWVHKVTPIPAQSLG